MNKQTKQLNINHHIRRISINKKTKQFNINKEIRLPNVK